MLKKAFLFVAILGFAAAFYWFNSQSPEQSKSNIKTLLISDKKVMEAGQAITFPNAEVFNPQTGDPFALLFWISFKNKLKVDQRMPVLYKFSQEGNKPGYALTITNYNNTVRPEVYWKNENGKGRWYSFPEINLKTNRWYGFLISYTDNKYLALKLFRLIKNTSYKTIKLGGYKVENAIAASTADLELGSIGNKSFSGAIGNVYTGKELLEEEIDFESLISLQPQ